MQIIADYIQSYIILLRILVTNQHKHEYFMKDLLHVCHGVLQCACTLHAVKLYLGAPQEKYGLHRYFSECLQDTSSSRYALKIKLNGHEHSPN